MREGRGYCKKERLDFSFEDDFYKADADVAPFFVRECFAAGFYAFNFDLAFEKAFGCDFGNVNAA